MAEVFNQERAFASVRLPQAGNVVDCDITCNEKNVIVGMLPFTRAGHENYGYDDQDEFFDIIITSPQSFYK